MRKFIWAMVGLVLVGLVTIAGDRYMTRWSGAGARNIDTPVEVEFPRGTRLADLSRDLEARGVISDARLFSLWVRLFRNYKTFQAGLYRFEGSVSPADIATALEKGDVWVPVVLQVTIPEGFTLRKIIDRLAANGVGSKRELQRLSRHKSFLTRLGIKASGLEGYLYPATYRFSEMPDAETALTRMVRTFRENLPPRYEEDLRRRGLTLREGVIFASLIEAETRYDDERSRISEVIWRRLKRGEPIGIDAAIIHGIKDYDGDIKWKHLKDAKNPYNTRIHKGLPPGPIGSPSEKSMRAVLTPTKKGYHYYVLTSKGDGRHHFSKTLQEHNRYVRLLLRSPKSNSR